MAARLWLAKLAVRVIGAVASLLFAWQAIWLAIHPDLPDFWLGCHWLGQVLLGLFAGLSSLFFEVKGGTQSVVTHLARFALNRLGLAVFYFWLGCYVTGGMGMLHTSEDWRRLAHASGVMAWIACVLNIIISCCAERGEADEGFVKSRDTSASAPPAEVEAPPAITYGAKDAASPAPTSAAGSAAKSPDPMSPSEGAWGEGGASPFVDEEDGPRDDDLAEQPSGGWNTMGGGRFGGF